MKPSWFAGKGSAGGLARCAVAAVAIGGVVLAARAEAAPAQIHHMKAGDARRDALLGASVAIGAGQMLAGAPGDAARASDEGAVYVFEQDGSGVKQRQKIVPPTSVATAKLAFGNAVDADGPRAIIGAPGGSVAYIYERSGSSWVKVAELVPSAAPGGSSTVPSEFGASVAISGDVAVVGARADSRDRVLGGAVYVFELVSGAWKQVARLVPGDGAVADMFGWSVDVEAGVVVAGSFLHKSESGAAYVFEKVKGAWKQVAQLGPAKGSGAARFGMSVTMAAGRVAVSAPTDPAATGSVYVFHRPSGAWQQMAKLTPATGGSSDECGASWGDSAVAMSADRLVVGCWSAGTSDAGGAWAWGLDGGAWKSIGRLSLTRPMKDARMGTSVALDGDVAAVGGPGDDDKGAVAVFGGVELPRKLGVACDAAAQCGSGMCVDGVCCDSVCGGGSPDDCMACSVNAGGVKNGTCGALSASVAPKTICRPAAGVCDVDETCASTSTECPVNEMVSAGTPCRQPRGVCDAPEMCDGKTAACPADALVKAGTLCRPAAGDCDVAERCNGSMALCPTDFLQLDGTACPGGACVAGTCQPTVPGGGGVFGGGGSGSVSGGSLPPSGKAAPPKADPGASAGSGAGDGGSAGCAVASSGDRAGLVLLWLIALGALVVRRRR